MEETSFEPGRTSPRFGVTSDSDSGIEFRPTQQVFSEIAHQLNSLSTPVEDSFWTRGFRQRFKASRPSTPTTASVANPGSDTEREKFHVAWDESSADLARETTEVNVESSSAPASDTSEVQSSEEEEEPSSSSSSSETTSPDSPGEAPPIRFGFWKNAEDAFVKATNQQEPDKRAGLSLLVNKVQKMLENGASAAEIDPLLKCLSLLREEEEPAQQFEWSRGFPLTEPLGSSNDTPPDLRRATTTGSGGISAICASEADEMRSYIEAQKRHLDSTMMMLARIDAERAELEHTVSVYRKADLDKGEYIAQLHRQITAHTDEKEGLKLLLTECENQRRDILAQLSNAQDKIRYMDTHTNTAPDANEELKKLNSQLEEDVRDMLRICQDYKHEVTVLKRKLAADGKSSITKTARPKWSRTMRLCEVKPGDHQVANLFSRGVQAHSGGPVDLEATASSLLELERLKDKVIVLELERKEMRDLLHVAREDKRTVRQAVQRLEERLKEKEGAIERLEFMLKCEVELRQRAEMGMDEIDLASQSPRQDSSRVSPQGSHAVSPRASHAVSPRAVSPRASPKASGFVDSTPAEPTINMECPLRSPPMSCEVAGEASSCEVAEEASCVIPGEASLETLDTITGVEEKPIIESIKLPPRPVSIATPPPEAVCHLPRVRASAMDPVPEPLLDLTALRSRPFGSPVPLSQIMSTNKPFRRTADVRKAAQQRGLRLGNPLKAAWGVRQAATPTFGGSEFGSREQTAA